MAHYGAAGPIGQPMTGTFVPQSTQGSILCCLCGIQIQPNLTNMCVNCIRSQVDISEGIQKQCTIMYCKECGRYLQPPKHWVLAELESKELLTFCIKRIKGMQKVKLVDAGFIWTEPHSKRLKVKLTIQKEVMNGAILQQTFVCEFVVEYNMCLDCNRANTNSNAWKASVQVRQHVEHKRTFMFLEQLILKHNAHEQCINIKNIHEGIDFFFGNRAHATKLIDFLQGVVPIRFRNDKQLVSHDTHTAEYNYKYTFSVEIAPICKDDLICLPPKLAQSFGNLGPLVLCSKVSNAIALMCPFTMRVAHQDAKQYFNSPYKCIVNSRQLVRYYVLDCEPVFPEVRHGRHVLADIQVARESDFGKNDTVFLGRTHLGAYLQAGDMALGYDLARHANADDNLEGYIHRGYQPPDFVLVRKCYDDTRNRRRESGKNRKWKLRHLAMEEEDSNVHQRRMKAQEETLERERERFMEELEEDPEMRQRVALYRDPVAAADAANEMEDDDDDELRELEVPLEELLDDLQGLGVAGPEDGAMDM